MTVPYRCLDVSEVGDTTVARLRVRKILDESTIQELADELSRLADDPQRNKFLLNFGSVKYLSSGMMGDLISLDKKIKARGGQLTLSEIQPEVYEAFTISKLNRLFDIRDVDKPNGAS